ncbi:hypothetical protein EJB05_42617, partial [Eragrostis curvula]
MATERRHRRSRRNRSKKNREEARPDGPTSVHDVPDHLLELVLLRLDSSATLLRAAAACKLWRRIITGSTGFLTRFRSLHAPCVAGHYHAYDPDWVEYGVPPITGSPVFVPSSSSSTAVVDSRRFSLDFLPESDSGWAIADSRGSLLLLFRKRTGWAERARESFYFPDLVVCDPLTRRYQGILRESHYSNGVFLLDGDGSGGHRIINMSNFRVVAVDSYYFETEPEGFKPVACVFTPGSDGGWRDLPTASTNSDAITLPGSTDTFAGRANGSLYWVTGEDGAMLALDQATTQFSLVTFPGAGADACFGGSLDKWSVRVIGGEDGALRVVRMVNSNLTIFVRHRDSEDLVVEKCLRLPDAAIRLPGCEDYNYFLRNAMIAAAHDTYILVTPQEKTCLFSVELDTMEVEFEHERNKYPGTAYPCELPWPPSLEACSDRGRDTQQKQFVY